MNLNISLGEKTILTLLVIYFSILSSMTAITIVADDYTTPIREAQLWGVADEVNINEDGNWAFKVIQGNRTVGGYVAPFPVENGNNIAVLSAQDSIYVPLLYQSRTWQEVYVDNEIVDTSESHFKRTATLALSGTSYLFFAASLVWMTYLDRKSK